MRSRTGGREMNKLKIEIILQIISTLVELLAKLVNNLKSEKGGNDDGEGKVDEHRTLHGG